MANVIVLLAVCLPLLQPALAVKCYQCNSKDDPKCEDPVGNGYQLVDCSQDLKQRENTRQAILEVLSIMTKLGQGPPPESTDLSVVNSMNETLPMACQKLEMTVHGEQVIGRGCSTKPIGFYRPCEVLSVITDKNILVRYCSLCDEDGCNSGWKTTLSGWLLSTMLLLTFFWH